MKSWGMSTARVLQSAVTFPMLAPHTRTAEAPVSLGYSWQAHASLVRGWVSIAD
eukprot:CAMPEP_0174385386 /NCGR_PEP_ID=MMETSP0811_2-20130205/126566_1 /TAXON_ID=73025 ORGANISM="Eutreptiella gymnastica-like, Strain CCMP1594" /NCGR_SAMPLE_ID=MMETSP0811_2 /ASSEMBLY_ACC=CAM_ASM_000667 /LENGTH=53 /DNA_ID=CAMNT_0015539687 /DNA_START=1435 /DNA_END=1596 /DNA_ORIENTATION=+